VGLLVSRHRWRGPQTESPRRLADRGLVKKLFQALAGAVLPDDDHYDDASLNSCASHATHATTRVSDGQGNPLSAGIDNIYSITSHTCSEKRKNLEGVTRCGV
jgi:hypothetical protein